jgi:hypothetical protein
MSDLSLAVILLIAALVLHLVEEVYTGFRTRLPVGQMPRPVFIGLNVLIYSFCLATLLLCLTDNPLAIPFAWAFAVAMLGNGTGHIGMMLLRRRYFPGGISAFVLLAVAGYLVSVLVGL